VTVSRFPRRDFESLSPYDPGRAPVEVDLSDNTNLWGPHPAATEVVRRSTPEALSRYPSVYATRLKEAVSRKFGVSPENVTTGCGSDDLLDSVFRAAALPPGRMTFPDPTFSMARVFGQMNGLAAGPVRWEDAARDPGALLHGQPDVVYLCRPNNPTGHSWPRGWVMDLLDAGGPDGPMVVLDEAYADYASDHFLQEAVSRERLLILRTFSKLHGLAGIRVGFGVGSPRLIREVEKSRGPYKVGNLAEAAATAALEDSLAWSERVVEHTLRNRRRLRAEMERLGLSPLPSEANFLLIPLTTGRMAGSGLLWGAQELNDALRTHGVAARPFPDLPGIGDALRVTIGPWPLMDRFIQAWEAVMKEKEATA